MSGITADSDTTLVLRREFAAPVARVYAAWTDPRALQQWYAPAGEGWTVPLAETDPRPGGAWRIEFELTGRGRFVEQGEYREVVPNERLVYTSSLRAGGEWDCDTVVTVVFTDLDGATLVEITETGYRDANQRDAHGSGWGGFLDRLDQLVGA